MHLLPNSSHSAATAFARSLAQWSRQRFGERMLGVYLIGSLAHGGFGPRYSDIDVAFVVQDQLSPTDLEAIRDAAAAKSETFANLLSLFWADRDFHIGRFPPLDRIDLLDHGITLLERERVRPARPTQQQIRSYLRGDPLRSWSGLALRFVEMKTLAIEDHKPYLRALLYPSRFLYSWETGGIVSNDEAVAFLERRSDTRIDIDLIRRALQCRNRGNDPGALFSERWKLARQRDAVLACVDEARRHERERSGN